MKLVSATLPIGQAVTEFVRAYGGTSHVDLALRAAQIFQRKDVSMVPFSRLYSPQLMGSREALAAVAVS